MSMENKYPSLIKQIKNIREFFHHSITYLVSEEYRGHKKMIVSDKIYQERLSICNDCERYDKSNQRCMECGCFMVLKAKFDFEYCPLHKWGIDKSKKTK